MWFNRFLEVATRQKWSTDDKLDELIPRLQGQVGEFVFDQLDSGSRRNYKTLVRELESRFRVVQIHQTFAAAFSHRRQKPGESPEDYTAKLKKLYSKAHGRRDPDTREEDLLGRFFDGLQDEKVLTQVEYVKEPKTINEAVDTVVGYMKASKSITMQTDRRQRSGARMVAPQEDPDEDEDEDTERLPAKITRLGASKQVNQNKNNSQNEAIKAMLELMPTVLTLVWLSSKSYVRNWPVGITLFCKSSSILRRLRWWSVKISERKTKHFNRG